MFHNKTKTHFQSMYVQELQHFSNVSTNRQCQI